MRYNILNLNLNFWLPEISLISSKATLSSVDMMKRCPCWLSQIDPEWLVITLIKYSNAQLSLSLSFLRSAGHSARPASFPGLLNFQKPWEHGFRRAKVLIWGKLTCPPGLPYLPRLHDSPLRVVRSSLERARGKSCHKMFVWLFKRNSEGLTRPWG